MKAILIFEFWILQQQNQKDWLKGLSEGWIMDCDLKQFCYFVVDLTWAFFIKVDDYKRNFIGELLKKNLINVLFHYS